jgi:hypothetical protein
MGSEMSYWLHLFGTIAGGVSLFNLIRRGFNIKLSELVAFVVELYQSIFYPIISIILFPLKLIGFAVPTWALDVATIYSIVGAAFFRGYSKLNKIEYTSKTYSSVLITHTAMAVIWPLSLTYLFFAGSSKKVGAKVYRSMAQLRRITDGIPERLRPVVRGWFGMVRVMRIFMGIPGAAVVVIIPVLTELVFVSLAFIVFFLLNAGLGLYKAF